MNLCSIVWFFKNEWTVMELNGMDSISYHHLTSFFVPSNLGGMEWNRLLISFVIIRTLFYPIFCYLPNYFIPLFLYYMYV